MRFIPTSDKIVETLKKQAKKLQRTNGGKHAEMLNRVAKSANYDHWHHVIQCHAHTVSLGSYALVAECFKIVGKAKQGISTAILTGPESAAIPFLLFSSEEGDAWLLEPTEGLVANLMWQGKQNPLRIIESDEQVGIYYDGHYEMGEYRFSVVIDEPDQLKELIGTRTIFSYPTSDLKRLETIAKNVSAKVLLQQ